MRDFSLMCIFYTKHNVVVEFCKEMFYDQYMRHKRHRYTFVRGCVWCAYGTEHSDLLIFSTSLCTYRNLRSYDYTSHIRTLYVIRHRVAGHVTYTSTAVFDLCSHGDPLVSPRSRRCGAAWRHRSVVTCAFIATRFVLQRSRRCGAAWRHCSVVTCAFI